MPRYRPASPLGDRFWARVERTETCWLWRGAIDSRGYGVMSLGARRAGLSRAHRVSWLLQRGRIPVGALLCHTCDVKACVRPDHLYLGTKRTNAADALARGQMSTGKAHPVPRGTAHWKAKLTDEQVTEIRHRRDAGELLRTLAADFGISEAHVSRLAHRLSR